MEHYLRRLSIVRLLTRNVSRFTKVSQLGDSESELIVRKTKFSKHHSGGKVYGDYTKNGKISIANRARKPIMLLLIHFLSSNIRFSFSR